MQWIQERVAEGTHVAGQPAGLPLLGVVPYDEQLAAAERRGLAPLDGAPTAPAVDAVGQLAVQLEQSDRPRL